MSSALHSIVLNLSASMGVNGVVLWVVIVVRSSVTPL